MSDTAQKDVSMVDDENGSDSEEIQDLAYSGIKKLVVVRLPTTLDIDSHPDRATASWGSTKSGLFSD